MRWNNLELPDNPYFYDDDVVIYHADCRGILPHLPKVDLVLTDIPFNVNHKYLSYNDRLSDEEYSALCYQWFNSMLLVSDAFIVKSPTKTMPVVLPVFSDVLGYVWTIIQHSPNTTSHGPFNLHLFTQYLIGGKPKKKPNTDFFVNTKNAIESNHPAEMPTTPIKRLIEWFTESNNILIDPFLGSGTTLEGSQRPRPQGHRY